MVEVLSANLLNICNMLSAFIYDDVAFRFRKLPEAIKYYPVVLRENVSEIPDEHFEFD